MRRAASVRTFRVVLFISCMSCQDIDAWSRGECSSVQMSPREALPCTEMWDVLARDEDDARMIAQREIDLFVATHGGSGPSVIDVRPVSGRHEMQLAELVWAKREIIRLQLEIRTMRTYPRDL